MKMQNGERPFGAGTAVLTPRIWRLQNRALEKDIIPEVVKVEYAAADLELAEPIRIGKKGEVLAARTWEEFAAIFVEELEHDLGEALEMAGKFNGLRAGDCNVLSALFLEGCIERAESPTRGGAARECPVMDLLGTPNVIDSLCVVKQFVYDEKRCGMEEIIAALDDDWKGHEKLWREIRHDGKFYGHNDAFSNEVAQFYHRAVAKFAAAVCLFGIDWDSAREIVELEYMDLARAKYQALGMKDTMPPKVPRQI